jgi:hypothetical protein
MNTGHKGLSMSVSELLCSEANNPQTTFLPRSLPYHGLPGGHSGREVGFWEIVIDFREAGFWLSSPNVELRRIRHPPN